MLSITPETLTDGTQLEELVDLERREVQIRVLGDDEIYEIEMEKVFGKAWLLLAHATEIPSAGDFVVRDMGSDQVIVARDRQGEIHVLLNMCPHRGMRVCMTEDGNASAFKCIYHGWTFRPNGDFIGAPVEPEKMHGDVLPKSELGLTKARVTLYGGFVFATWNHDGPSLEDWLGDYKFYTDAMFLRTHEGLEMLGPPQKCIIDANWKTAGEQFAGDGFHALTLHRSLMEMGRMGGSGDLPEEVAPAMYAVNVSANGHGMRLIPPYMALSSLIGKKPTGLGVMERLELLPPPAMSKEMVPQLAERLSPSQLELLAEYPPSAGGLFPNVGFLWYYTQNLDGTLGGRMTLHTMLPRGPNKFEFTTWVFSEKCASDEMKQQILTSSVQAMGNTGMTEQDDSETWPHMQRNAHGAKGRHGTLKYQALGGYNKPADFPGGGNVFAGFAKDDNQWEWWKRWHEMMIA